MDDPSGMDDSLGAFAFLMWLDHMNEEEKMRRQEIERQITETGITPLMIAAAKGSVRGVENLIAQGVDVNAQNHLGATALMYTIDNSSSIDVARILIEHGADINIRDAYGRTALMHAAYNGKEDLVTLLTEKGADVHLKDNEGKTALAYAAEKGYSRIAELLKIAGWKQYPPNHFIGALKDLIKEDPKGTDCRKIHQNEKKLGDD